MKSFKFRPTAYRKVFLIIHNMFGHMNKLIPIGLLLFMFMSCGEAKPQTRQQKREAEKLRNRENLEQYYLAALKMCEGTDYESYFGTYREMNSWTTEGNCCTALFPQPYIDPYEYYIELTGEEKAIMLNHGDPFELKRIREKMKGERDNVRVRALKMDTNNLVYNTSGLFVKYDLNKEEIKLNLSSNLSFTAGPFAGRIKGVHMTNLPSEFGLPLKSDEAKKLFEYYQKNSPLKQLMQMSPMNIRLIYRLRFPERNNKNSKFDGVLKTIEVYPADNWTYKIGEITF
ncbi:hypothetical protein FGF1_33840 [Flavobacteriaceae bacterium GF1]